MAKCPKCEAVIIRVQIEQVAAESGDPAWRTVTYACPSCEVVLSVGVAPAAGATGLSRTLEEALAGPAPVVDRF